MNPMASAHLSPFQSKSGETANAKTTCPEAPAVDAVKPSKIAHAITAPTAPPKIASNIVSSSTEITIGIRRNPMARKVAISRDRPAIAI